MLVDKIVPSLAYYEWIRGVPGAFVNQFDVMVLTKVSKRHTHLMQKFRIQECEDEIPYEELEENKHYVMVYDDEVVGSCMEFIGEVATL